MRLCLISFTNPKKVKTFIFLKFAFNKPKFTKIITKIKKLMKNEYLMESLNISF